MKKSFFKFPAAFACIFIMSIYLYGCSASERALAGYWTVEDESAYWTDGSILKAFPISLELYDDGTGILNMPGCKDKQSVRWSAKGSVLKMKLGGEYELDYDFYIDGMRLTLSDSRHFVVYRCRRKGGADPAQACIKLYSF